MKENKMQEEKVICFTTSRVACIHRLKPDHIPRGLEPEDVMLSCEYDPDCPELINKK